MEGMNGQLQTKYQKIAAEYSKIRAQASVLKKAVIDEQARTSELKDQLKDKDVSLRRAEQELDSLIFRNQQLTKRVTVLQEELDNTQNKSKKGKNKTLENKDQPPPPPNHVYVEEFQKKIVENAQLLSQLADKDNEIEELDDRIKHLEYKLDLSEKSRIELDSKYQERIEKLEREKNDLQRKISERQKHDETGSWSSIEGKCSYDYELKSGITNHRQVDHSPFSSPSVSRRSSKSMGGDVRCLKNSDYHDENNTDFELTKLCDVEKELQQYKSDYNILKIKYDDLLSKDNLVMQQMQTETLEPLEINNMIGRLLAPFAIPEEIEAREAKIREYFMRQIDKLIEEKQIYHAKNLAMVTNNVVMTVHLDTSEEKRDKCEVALSEALSNLTNSQEEKEVQEGHYKAQLSTMTEHLANMNEKLIQQTEEIQQLKYELGNKNGKKGKQK